MTTTQDTNFGERLGKAVKELREQQGLSQEGLREKANFSSGYISRLESGEYSAPSISHVYYTAKALDMNLRDLLEYADLIPHQSTFESCLRGEGASKDEIEKILSFKNYVLHTEKSSKAEE